MCLSNIQVQLIEFRSFCEEDVDEILAFELENREYFERWFSRKHDVHDCGQLLIHEICQPGNIRQYEHSFIVRYLGRIIGRTTLHAIDRVVANSAAMEYCVAERFSGCGIAPAATSNSSICGRVKFPQRGMTGRVIFTRWPNLSQAGQQPL